MKIKKNILKIIIINLFVLATVQNSFAETKVIKFIEKNTLVGETILDNDKNDYNLPISKFGQYFKNGEIREANNIICKVTFVPFNVDFKRPYVILRDSHLNVLKVYNTDMKKYNFNSLQKDKLNEKYYIKSDIDIDIGTEIVLQEKEAPSSSIKDTKDLIMVNVSLTVGGKTVKSFDIKAEKGKRPDFPEFEYEGKKYKVNKYILPVVEDSMSITIPIDSPFYATNIQQENNDSNLHSQTDVDSLKHFSLTEGSNSISVTEHKYVMPIEGIEDTHTLERIKSPSYSVGTKTKERFKYNKPKNTVKINTSELVKVNQNEKTDIVDKKTESQDTQIAEDNSSEDSKIEVSSENVNSNNKSINDESANTKTIPENLNREDGSTRDKTENVEQGLPEKSN